MGKRRVKLRETHWEKHSVKQMEKERQKVMLKGMHWAKPTEKD